MELYVRAMSEQSWTEHPLYTIQRDLMLRISIREQELRLKYHQTYLKNKKK